MGISVVGLADVGFLMARRIQDVGEEHTRGAEREGFSAKG
jgi:hypothetical protein